MAAQGLCRYIRPPLTLWTKFMKVQLKSNELIIKIPIQEPKISSSGKTLIIASSFGSQQTDVIIDGKPVFVGLTAYIKK